MEPFYFVLLQQKDSKTFFIDIVSLFVSLAIYPQPTSCMHYDEFLSLHRTDLSAYCAPGEACPRFQGYRNHIAHNNIPAMMRKKKKRKNLRQLRVLYKLRRHL